MCGIGAIIGNKKQSMEMLEEILQRIIYRGDKEYFNESAEFDGCVMGTNRLAIVGRDTGKQPILSNNGRYACILNGEIYNYKELREQLIEKGYKFSTDSDTEVLAKGYVEWSSDIVEKLDGMFSFIVFDTKTKEFFVARDPFGIKPLYWAQDEEKTYYFASEVKSLIPIESIKEIKLFPPGHFMSNRTFTKYWSIESKIDHDITEEVAIETLRRLFDEAIKKRVQTDLPVAVYMSGGIDSTAVLATARKFNNNVTAIIVGNEKSTDKEVAIKYCEENNIKYIVESPPTEKELAKYIPWAVEHSESFEPNMIRPTPIFRYIVKPPADNGFKVILCGEGADELFGGYPEFALAKDSKEVERRSVAFSSDLHRTQLQRVDRISMVFTTEVRVPFLDKDFASYALQISGDLKVKKVFGEFVTKYILRKAMSDRLPEYIYNRKKVVLHEGAGYGGNNPKEGGMFYDLVSKNISDEEFEKYKEKYSEWNLHTKEEVHYFKLYQEYGYEKAKFNQKRTMVNKINSMKSR